jgi:hypothetical protein
MNEIVSRRSDLSFKTACWKAICLWERYGPFVGIQQCTNSASGGENSSTGKVHGSRKELEPKAVVKTIEAIHPHFCVRQ